MSARSTSFLDADVGLHLKISNYEETVRHLDIYYGIGRWPLTRTDRQPNPTTNRTRLLTKTRPQTEPAHRHACGVPSNTDSAGDVAMVVRGDGSHVKNLRPLILTSQPVNRYTPYIQGDLFNKCHQFWSIQYMLLFWNKFCATTPIFYNYFWKFLVLTNDISQFSKKIFILENFNWIVCLHYYYLYDQPLAPLLSLFVLVII